MKNLGVGTKIEFKDFSSQVKETGVVTDLIHNGSFLFKSDYDGLHYSSQSYERFNLTIID